MSSNDSGLPAAVSGRARSLADEVLEVLYDAPRTVTVLLDGPSGSGKSTLADGLVAAWTHPVQPTLVRLDDIYPGWSGLDAAVKHLHNEVLLPRQEGRPAAWQRYDWATGKVAEWNTVDPSAPLIVEGCGALARAHVSLSDVRIWLVADDKVRKERALRRDSELFREHWDHWQRDWDFFQARESPERWATIRLRNDN